MSRGQMTQGRVLWRNRRFLSAVPPLKSDPVVDLQPENSNPKMRQPRTMLQPEDDVAERSKMDQDEDFSVQKDICERADGEI